MTAATESAHPPESEPCGAEWFDAFCRETEPTLRRALIAAYGLEPGQEATADAITWAWEHRDRVRSMDNPGGYLWRVGQSSARRNFRRREWTISVQVGPVAQDSAETSAEPALESAMKSLSPRQRTAIVLVHGYGYSLSEAATHMNCRIRTLRNHLERGMASLRKHLGVSDDG